VTIAVRNGFAAAVDSVHSDVLVGWGRTDPRALALRPATALPSDRSQPSRQSYFPRL
jgi:hypothetical protein